MGGRHRLERQAKKTGESQGKIIRDELARARKGAAAQSFMPDWIEDWGFGDLGLRLAD